MVVPSNLGGRTMGTPPFFQICSKYLILQQTNRRKLQLCSRANLCTLNPPLTTVTAGSHCLWCLHAPCGEKRRSVILRNSTSRHLLFLTRCREPANLRRAGRRAIFFVLHCTVASRVTCKTFNSNQASAYVIVIVIINTRVLHF